MEVYLVDKKGNLLETFKNVVKWDTNSVEYAEGVMKTKQYCSAEEYFTDTPPQTIEENVSQETIKEEPNV